MRVRPGIGVRRPMTTVRAFGLLDPGWPSHRRVRMASGGKKRMGAVERRFRKERSSAPPVGAAAPVNLLSLTHLTLCPRLEILWQSHHAAVTEMAADTPLRGDGPAALRDRIVRPLAPGLSLTVERTERRWHRLSSLRLSVWERYRDAFRGNATSDRPEIASPPVSGHATIRPLVLREHRSRHTTDRHTRFAQRSVPFRTERTQRVAETTEAQLGRFLRTVVTRRVMGFGPADEALPMPGPIERSPGGATWRDARTASSAQTPPGQEPPGQTLSALRTVPAPRWIFHPEPASSPTAPAAPAPRVLSPLDRVFRAGPAAPPPAPAAPAPQPRLAEAPPVDIAHLDKELWRRFEKRIRIEQERRGRG